MISFSRKLNKALLTVAVVSLAMVSTAAMAEMHPIRLSSDHRIEVVAYSPYNVVPIHGTTFTTTQVTFNKDEFIQNVQNGDLGAWTASISKDIPNMMFVKPTAYNSHTNMTVVTNKHTYYFTLTSNAEGQAHQTDATYAIKFIYPAQKRAKVEKELIKRARQRQAEISAFRNPADYNWDYSFHGCKSIIPIHVFDDGKFTYMQLQRGQSVPAIFAVTNPNGKESVVNYRRDGQYLVIQRTAPQFTLRVGKSHVATVFNDKQIKKLRGNRFF